MFESSEPTSSSSVIVVNNTPTNIIPNSPVVVETAISALNEAIVEAIDNHNSFNNGTHLNMLSSYYYCSNFLDFKHHFNQNFNVSGYSLMPTSQSSSMATSSTQPSSSISTTTKPHALIIDLPKPLHQNDLDLVNEASEHNEFDDFSNYKNFNSNKTLETPSAKTTVTQSPPNLFNSHQTTLEPLRGGPKLKKKRPNFNLKRLSSSVSQKKSTSLSKVKSILFKTYRNVVARNRLRYTRCNSRSFKSSSLSPTSPSSSSSSTSSCSNSPELVSSDFECHKKTSFMTSAYKNFKKIRNRLLKCNTKELRNELGEESEDEDLPTSSSEQQECYSEVQTSTSVTGSSNITTLSTQTTTASSHYQPTDSYNSTHEFSQQSYVSSQLVQVQQQFGYDVEMMPYQQFPLDDEQSTLNQTFPQSPFTQETPIHQTQLPPQQPPSADNSTIQQCQVKQDLLKLSYDKFKQFRLNEKLLQQTVLIRNAIKMLQYDIQFQQEQEQIIIQQQQITQQNTIDSSYVLPKIS